MTDRTLTWQLPPVSNRQAQHDFTRIEFRASADLPWTTQDEVPADGPQQLVFVDVNAGQFWYKATLFDVLGQMSEPVEITAELPYDPPGSVLGFNHTDT